MVSFSIIEGILSLTIPLEMLLTMSVKSIFSDF